MAKAVHAHHGEASALQSIGDNAPFVLLGVAVSTIVHLYVNENRLLRLE